MLAKLGFSTHQLGHADQAAAYLDEAMARAAAVGRTAGLAYAPRPRWCHRTLPRRPPGRETSLDCGVGDPQGDESTPRRHLDTDGTRAHRRNAAIADGKSPSRGRRAATECLLDALRVIGGGYGRSGRPHRTKGVGAMIAEEHHGHRDDAGDEQAEILDHPLGNCGERPHHRPYERDRQ